MTKFKYLGRMLEEKDSDWTEVHWNISNEWAVMQRLGKFFRQERVGSRVSELFYITASQGYRWTYDHEVEWRGVGWFRTSSGGRGGVRVQRVGALGRIHKKPEGQKADMEGGTGLVAVA